jgi:7,8-dihydroneopterin aldolase/epimerase/oxygenase
MIKISLARLKMFGYHGLHREEKITGAEFEIQLDVFFEPKEMIRDIAQTVNYEELYTIIRNKMQVPADLLETIGMEISNSVKELYPEVKEINITISKINPPLMNFRGELSVSVINAF